MDKHCTSCIHAGHEEVSWVLKTPSGKCPLGNETSYSVWRSPGCCTTCHPVNHLSWWVQEHSYGQRVRTLPVCPRHVEDILLSSNLGTALAIWEAGQLFQSLGIWEADQPFELQPFSQLFNLQLLMDLVTPSYLSRAKNVDPRSGNLKEITLSRLEFHLYPRPGNNHLKIEMHIYKYLNTHTYVCVWIGLVHIHVLSLPHSFSHSLRCWVFQHLSVSQKRQAQTQPASIQWITPYNKPSASLVERGFALGCGKFMQVPDFLHWLLKSRAPFKFHSFWRDLSYDQGGWFNSSLHLAGTQGTLAQMLCQVVSLTYFLMCFPAMAHVVFVCSSAPKANTGVMFGDSLQLFTASGFSRLGCQCFKVFFILFAGHHCLSHGLNLIHRVLNGLP